MWPFTKKQPILRVLSREYLGSKMEPSMGVGGMGVGGMGVGGMGVGGMGVGGMGTDVDTFSIYAVTYQNVETGETFLKQEMSLEF